MKKVLYILYLIVSTLIMLLATVFIIIEGRLFFVGDWLLHQYPILGFLQYLLRFLFALGAFVVGLFAFINGKKRTFLWGSGALLIVSLGMVFFLTNYFGEIFLGVSLVYFILHFLVYTFCFAFVQKKK